MSVLEHGPNCVTKQLCQKYDALVAEFATCGTWYGPPSDSPAYQTIKSTSLRAWWNSHGCVRCYILAWNKMNQSSSWDQYCFDLPGGKARISNPNALPEIEKAIHDWKTPGTRLPNRYYCRKCVQRLPCGVGLFQILLNDLAIPIAGGNGHTGWAYGVPDAWQDVEMFNYPDDDPDAAAAGQWRAGEKTLLGELANLLHGHGGREITLAGDANAYFGDHGYVAWKQLWANDGNFEEAFLTALNSLETPYLVIFNNCNQATHAVLTAFGAGGIPSGNSFWKPTYMPGDYFDFVKGTLVTFDDGHDPAADPVPHPRPAPAPPQFKNQSEARTGRRGGSRPEEPGTDAIYRLEGRDTLHLRRTCPALLGAGLDPKEHGVDYTEDLNGLARAFGGRICALCLRAAHDGIQVVHDIPLADGVAHFCRDRLRFVAPEGRGEVLYERIVGHGRKWISLKPVAQVMYRNPMPDGGVDEGTIEATFATAEDRDGFLAKLSEILSE